jgi:hypothetical protein
MVAGIVMAAGGVAWAQAPGLELPVNQYVTGSQERPAVAVDADGNFVVVWDSLGQDGDLHGVFARRFDGAGQALGPEFQVNSDTVDSQRAPAIAMRPSGEFVVVWQSFGQDGSFGGIFGQGFDASGASVGSEFQVNSISANAQRVPAVAMDATGSFVVVWQGYTFAGLWDVWGRRFDASGNPLGGDFRVNAYTTDHQANPSLAMDGSGNFVVAWESYKRDSFGGIPSASLDIFGRRFDSSGTPQGPDFQANSTAGTRAAKVAVDAAGEFMVVWQSGFFYGGISGRRFDAAGATVGPEIQVETSIYAGEPTVAAAAAGEFVVAWKKFSYVYIDEDNYYNYDYHVRLRRYDAAGNPGPVSRADTSTIPIRTYRGRPSVAARTPGHFIVAWQGDHDGSGRGVFARPVDTLFEDGFESHDLSAWSASATDGGDLGASSGAGLAGTAWGLQAVVDDQAGIYVQDDTPDHETRYRARFYVDGRNFDPGEAIGQFRQHIFLAFQESPLKRLVLIILKRQNNQYSIAAQVRRDDDTLAMTPFAPLGSQVNFVELDWQRASAPGANDGRLELWANGTSVATLTGLDNDERSIDFVRLGAVSVKAGASGTLLFDEFVSRRRTYIGP